MAIQESGDAEYLQEMRNMQVEAQEQQTIIDIDSLLPEHESDDPIGLGEKEARRIYRNTIENILDIETVKV